MKIQVVTNVLDANERITAENRALFDAKGIYAINLMSVPGAGSPSSPATTETVAFCGSVTCAGSAHGPESITGPVCSVRVTGTTISPSSGSLETTCNAVLSTAPSILVASNVTVTSRDAWGGTFPSH